MFSKLAEGGLGNLRKMAYIVCLGIRKFVSANQDDAEEFMQEFSDYVIVEGLCSQKRFNCN